MPLPEFTVMRGVDLYYQFLNAGFRLPIAAGTDKVGEDMPLGSNRTYVPARAAPDYAGWLAGVKLGTGYVTNSPLLELRREAAPRRDGRSSRARGGSRVPWRARRCRSRRSTSC
jgi:hypothetical protein